MLHFVLEQAESGDLSVGGLVAGIKKKASRPEEITSRLLALDCGNPDASEWNRAHFRLEKEDLYIVDGAFPKIVPNTFGSAGVPAGIGSITYEVDLTCAAASLIDPTKSKTTLVDLVACLSQD